MYFSQGVDIRCLHQFFLTKWVKFGIMQVMIFRDTIKKLWKPFVLIFLLVFLIINWQDVALVFNYRFIYGKFKQVVEKTPEKVIETVEKQDSIVVPKISIEAPIVFAEVGETQNLEKYLKNGVLLYPDSVLPGQAGRTVLLGHSAPAGWPDIDYDRIFTELNELNNNDKIYVYFNKREYIYTIKNKYFLDKGEELPENLTNSQNVLILLSCWPPGKDLYRIAVEAEIQ